ncbi:solute carrier family 43 member 3 [Protopterus annectens]|uniref:solute carrier family 43 member 3 n=1 Tax=Protopterus annectens TaxID=7888 RepID=UPI001CFAD50F|nr:solute carrier family 43 member 3 [Protopterus annectens]
MGTSGMELKKLATFITGLLECMCFAGVVFGWASLVFVLKTDGYFSNLCFTLNVTDSSNSTGQEDCGDQDEAFSIVFTIAAFMNNFMTLPNGYIFDRFGTTYTRLIAIFIYTGGTLMIAFSSPEFAVLLYPALSLLSIGGILFLITNIQIGNLYGSRRSTVITLYNGAFDSSSSIFLLVKILHEYGVTLKSMFLFFSGCSILHILRTFFLLPKSHIPFPVPKDYSYGVTCGKSSSFTLINRDEGQQQKPNSSPVGEEEEENTEEQNSMSINQKDPEESGRSLLNKETDVLKLQSKAKEEPVESFKSCVFSSLFLWQIAWLSIMQLRHYLYIGTLNPFLNHLAHNDSKKVSTFTNAFAFTQLCGVLCAPWNGIILDRHKHKKKKDKESQEKDTLADVHATILSLAITVTQCVLFSLCAAIPVLEIQYASFILQVINRSFLYGGNAAFLSIAFPACLFGKLYGVVMSFSAIVSLLQYPCLYLIKGPLKEDPLYVNIALIIFMMLSYGHPINVYLYCRKQRNSGRNAGRSSPHANMLHNQEKGSEVGDSTV